jgi:hypothetical protein
LSSSSSPRRGQGRSPRGIKQFSDVGSSALRTPFTGQHADYYLKFLIYISYEVAHPFAAHMSDNSLAA